MMQGHSARAGLRSADMYGSCAVPEHRADRAGIPELNASFRVVVPHARIHLDPLLLLTRL